MEARLAHHFRAIETQRHAERLGMWLFLATEVLLFAGLFCGYTLYRYLYPETFKLASAHLDVFLGTVNTVVLISSSLTVALAHHFAHRDRSRMAGVLLFVSVLAGLAFLGVKAVEYTHKFEEGLLPGRYFHAEGLTAPGASMFFTVYFLTTGLHAFHVVVGMGVLVWIGVRAWRGEFHANHSMPVELGGLYWHLVDLVWIFLYPLLYLV
ncbi:MAG TPA: cytochrome c oxidase subunit 3 family protein [Myxococcales bacterium]|nr:cytochrome c oxidase subunit 3 family protein [Myxococcales bacterium]